MAHSSDPLPTTASPLNELLQQIRLRDVVMATLTIAALVLALFLLYRFAYILLSLVIVIMLYLAVRPLVEWLYRLGVSKQVGVMVGYGLMVAFVVGFLVLLIPMMLGQVRMITARLPEYYTLLKDLMAQSNIALLQLAVSYLPPALDLARLPQLLLPASPDSGAPVTGLSLYGVLTNTFLVIAIFAMGFYWMRDRDKIVYQFLLLLPTAQRDRVEQLIEEVEQKVGYFYQGQLLLCSAVGGVSFLAYWLVGLPYALTLGAFAFVFEAVPLIGPLLGAIPAILIALTISPTMTGIVILINATVQFLENNILVPRIMDRAVGVNPILTVLAIASFTTLLGLTGALLAVPLAAIIQLLFERIVFHFRAPESSDDLSAAPLPGVQERNHYSVLRVKAQDLAQDVRKQLRTTKTAVTVENVELEELIEAYTVELERLLARQEVAAAQENQLEAKG
ncbi:MAG: AI-2E family transporter [Caldilinea sp. CFX5]|nr:AI-2E family transporter [Caldilinea sp. CFX5]